VTVHEAILHLERELESAAAQDLPRALGDLERLKARAWLRIQLEVVPRPQTAEARASQDERLLTPEAAAGVVGGLSPRWFSRHRKNLPFLRKVGKYLRIEESGFRRWLASRKTLTP
jgi:hypothetical protein